MSHRVEGDEQRKSTQKWMEVLEKDRQAVKVIDFGTCYCECEFQVSDSSIKIIRISPRWP